jgi:hypothetical protein
MRQHYPQVRNALRSMYSLFVPGCLTAVFTVATLALLDCILHSMDHLIGLCRTMSGAGVAAVGEVGVELKMKDGDVVRLHYDTEIDRNMWLGILAPGLVAQEAGASLLESTRD